MHDNKTLGPTTFPKRHLFFDTDNLVEWDLKVEQRFYQVEKVPITGLQQGPPGYDYDRTNAAGFNAVFVDGHAEWVAWPAMTAWIDAGSPQGKPYAWF